MQQYILVPLDGSAQAETILPYVVALARATQRALHLVHVLPPPYVSIPREGITIALPRNYQAALKADASDYLLQLATHLEPEGMEVDTSVLEGEPAAAIIALGHRTPGVPLIAMTTLGHGGFHHLSVNGVAANIARTTSLPLFLLHPHPGDLPVPRSIAYHRLLVLLDGSTTDGLVLEVAQHLVSVFHAARLLLSVKDSAVPSGPGPSDTASPIETVPAGTQMGHAMDIDVSATVLQPVRKQEPVEQMQIPRERLAEAIQQVCQQYHPDALVMASPRQGTQRLSSHARMAAEVIETLGKPVLLINQRHERDQAHEQTPVLAQACPADTPLTARSGR